MTELRQSKCPIYDARNHTYTFGYPVLMAGKHDFPHLSHRGLLLQRSSDRAMRQRAIARRSGADIRRPFSALQRDTVCELSTHRGETIISVYVQNTAYDVQGTNALRHIDVTLRHEGKNIDGESLRAFVMGAR